MYAQEKEKKDRRRVLGEEQPKKMWNDKYFFYLRALFLEGALKKSQQPENDRHSRFFV